MTIILDAVLEPVLALADPAKRVYIPFLLISLLIGTLASLWFRSRDFFPPLIGEAKERSLSKKVWLGKSAQGDYKLLFANAVIRALLITPLLATPVSLAVLTAALLESSFGVPTSLSTSRTTVALLYTGCLFVLGDLSRYVLHRLVHTVPRLWEIHKVHHSATTMTPFTLYRQHPIELFLSDIRRLLVIGTVTGCFLYFFRHNLNSYDILGVNALGFVFNLLGANLRHSHAWLSYGITLEKLFISPAQHQIHHGKMETHYSSNYGSCLAIWDRIGGTLLGASGVENLEFGLDDETDGHNSLVGALVTPLIGMTLGRTLKRYDKD